MRLDEVSPITALVAHLIHRGSVLPETFDLCIDRVHEGIEVKDAIIEQADDIVARLFQSA